jgi:hypothetical protein
LIAGLAASLAMHVALPGLVAAAAGLLASAGVLPPESSAQSLPAPEPVVVEARFVRLGTQLDPRRLPDRAQPQANTAPQNPNRFSKRNRIRRSEQRHRPQPDSVDDMLQRLGDRAEVFNREARARELEGHEQGVQGGTEREASPEALYNGLLYRFFRRGWSVPPTIPPELRSGLVARVQVSIGRDRRVTGFSIGSPSGNAIFDGSVRGHLQRIQGSGRLVPEPPPEIAERYLGRSTAFRFSGR